MRKIILLLAVIFTSILSYSGNPEKDIKLKSGKTSCKIVNGNDYSFTVYNSISVIREIGVTSKAGNFTKLLIDGYVGTKQIGFPELPVITRLLEIPFGAEVKISVVGFDEEIIDLGANEAKLLPTQPSLSKSLDVEDVEFYYNEKAYTLNRFSSEPKAEVDVLGKMRGVQLGRLRVQPFSYNPETNQLKVYNNLKIEVSFPNADISRTKANEQGKYSPVFSQNFNRLVNHKNIERELITIAPLKYVIISDPMFANILQPFIEWKTKKGFNVVVGYTDDPAVGNTTTSIKNYLANEYNSATTNDPAPSFVLLVGDIQQIPTFQGTAGSHVTDLYYFEYDGGGDIYPELYYGRFSATNNEQLQPQIDKTLEYEQYLMPDPSFLNEVVMIAGVDASNAPTYGNGQINYGTDNYFNAAHGLLSHTYLYPLSAASTSAAEIIADVSNGVAFANYTAHCSPSGWADPSFTTSNISGLANAHQYPLMIGNCCSSVEFQQNECFGEAILRAADKGAMGYIGGSNSTYWNEDYWWGVGSGAISANPTYAGTGLGSYDRLFHDNGEAEVEWYITNGQMVQAGDLAVTQAGGAETYYWEIYHLMGDPSVTTFLSVPDPLVCTHYAAVPVGTGSLVVTTEENAYVAISMDGVLLDAAIADATGIATLNFPGLTNVGTASVVATKQNRAPYIGTLDVIVSNAPFVVYSQFNINDSLGNNNSLADFGETVNLDVTLNNLGTVDALGVNAVLSTADTNITIIQNTANFGNILASSNALLSSAYQIQVGAVFEDQHIIPMTIDVTDNNGGSWSSSLVMTINAPVLSIENIQFSDAAGGNGNSIFDPGEIIVLTYDALNSGHAMSDVAISSVSSSSQYINVTTNPVLLGQMGISASDSVEAVIVVDPQTPMFESVDLTVSIEAGDYSSEISLQKQVGLLVETWEANTFTSFNWNNSVDVPWTLQGNETYEGNLAAQSGSIGNNQTSTLSIDIDVTSADSISFYKKVSCEAPGYYGIYDKLEFFIDNVSKGEWGGEIDWSKESFYISAGTHTCKWVYSKDANTVGGSDCAWVDFISFPQMQGSSTNNAPVFTSTPVTEVNKNELYSYTITTNDIDGDQCELSAVSIPAWLSFTDNGDGTGTLSGTPGDNDVYTHSIALSVTDAIAFNYQSYNLTVIPPASLNEIQNDINFNIYPNPISTRTNISFDLNESGKVKLSVLNSLGQEISVIVNSKFQNGGNYNYLLDVSSYNSGIYFCKLETEKGDYIRKLIITK